MHFCSPAAPFSGVVSQWLGVQESSWICSACEDRSCSKDNRGAPASERQAWESQTDAPPLSSWELEWSSAAEIEGSSAADAAQRKKRAATIGLVAFLIVVGYKFSTGTYSLETKKHTDVFFNMR